eukprot:3427113-Amphidinium_carterae.1
MEHACEALSVTARRLKHLTQKRGWVQSDKPKGKGQQDDNQPSLHGECELGGFHTEIFRDNQSFSE